MFYYGQFSPEVDFILNQRYIKDKRDGFAMEIGAFDGLVDSNCKFLEEFLGWKVLNIEASPTLFSRLEINRPQSINVFCAIANYNGVIEFTKTYRNDMEIGLGTVVPQCIDEDCYKETIEVPALTYKTIIEKYKIEKVDFISIDIEGYEPPVLADMINTIPLLSLPNLLCVEHGHCGQRRLIETLENVYRLDSDYRNNSFFIKI